jgi:hypothetical protein
MQRCHGDPMYTILFYPEEENLLSEYIKLCTKVVIKRYQIKDAEILRVFKLLETIDNDPIIRKFALLFFINWETNLAKGLEDAFDETKKGTLYEENAKKHYNAFVGKMEEFVDKTVKFAYTKYNVIEMVTEFEKAARLEYVMGPF